MRILAFETSCDDTCVAIVDNGTRVLVNTRTHQNDAHTPHGGIVPEVAARLHADRWRGVLEEAMQEAKTTWSDIDAIAVTQGPGLGTSLLTGTTAASFLALLHDKPLIPVHHIWGHLLSPLLDRNIDKARFPALVLTVSGGHTNLVKLHALDRAEVLGKTRDDAAGEAFDKVARVLGLGYPGGPAISKMAEMGDKNAHNFPKSMLEKDSLDFSFSGVKAAVKRHTEQIETPITEKQKADICASFQRAVVETLTKKVKRALGQPTHANVRSLWLVGGVSANTALRRSLEELAESWGLDFACPAKMEYCTDNAAMIGGVAAIMVAKHGLAAFPSRALDARGRWVLPEGL